MSGLYIILGDGAICISECMIEHIKHNDIKFNFSSLSVVGGEVEYDSAFSKFSM